MGGTIEAANRTDRQGAIFAITLPVPASVPLPEEETT
jgi:K+-sensing histidine kinase KdpD